MNGQYDIYVPGDNGSAASAPETEKNPGKKKKSRKKLILGLVFGIGIPLTLIMIFCAAYAVYAFLPPDLGGIIRNSSGELFDEWLSLAEDVRGITGTVEERENFSIDASIHKDKDSLGLANGVDFDVKGNFGEDAVRVAVSGSSKGKKTGIDVYTDHKTVEFTTDVSLKDKTVIGFDVAGAAEKMDKSWLNPEVNEQSPFTPEQYASLRLAVEALETSAGEEDEDTEPSAEAVKTIRSVSLEISKTLGFTYEPVFFKHFHPDKIINIGLDTDKLLKCFDIWIGALENEENKAFREYVEGAVKSSGYEPDSEDESIAVCYYRELRDLFVGSDFKVSAEMFVSSGLIRTIKLELDVSGVKKMDDGPQVLRGGAFALLSSVSDTAPGKKISADIKLEYGLCEKIGAKIANRPDETSKRRIIMKLTLETTGAGENAIVPNADTFSTGNLISEGIVFPDGNYNFTYTAEKKDAVHSFNLHMDAICGEFTYVGDEKLVYDTDTGKYSAFENGDEENPQVEGTLAVKRDADGEAERIDFTVEGISIGIPELYQSSDSPEVKTRLIPYKLENPFSLSLECSDDAAPAGPERGTELFCEYKDLPDAFLSDGYVITNLVGLIENVAVPVKSDAIRTEEGIILESKASFELLAKQYMDKYVNLLNDYLSSNKQIDEKMAAVRVYDEKRDIWILMALNSEKKIVNSSFVKNLTEEYSQLFHEAVPGDRNTLVVHKMKKEGGLIKTVDSGDLKAEWEYCQVCGGKRKITVYYDIQGIVFSVDLSEDRKTATLRSVSVLGSLPQCLEFPTYADKEQTIPITVIDITEMDFFNRICAIRPGKMTERIEKKAFSEVWYPTVVVLPKSLKSIGDSSIHILSERYDQKLFYEGSQDDWKQVYVGRNLPDDRVIFNFDGGKIDIYLKTDEEITAGPVAMEQSRHMADVDLDKLLRGYSGVSVLMLSDKNTWSGRAVADPETGRIFCACTDGSLHVFSARDGKKVNYPVTRANFVSCGSGMTVIGEEGGMSISVYDSKTQKELYSFRDPGRDKICDAVIDGKNILVGTAWGEAYVLNIDTGKKTEIGYLCNNPEFVFDPVSRVVCAFQTDISAGSAMFFDMSSCLFISGATNFDVMYPTWGKAYFSGYAFCQEHYDSFEMIGKRFYERNFWCIDSGENKYDQSSMESPIKIPDGCRYSYVVSGGTLGIDCVTYVKSDDSCETVIRTSKGTKTIPVYAEKVSDCGNGIVLINNKILVNTGK